jgi:hypothetical protein
MRTGMNIFAPKEATFYGFRQAKASTAPGGVALDPG